ncbi:hypothetical protein OWM07_08320 [Deferribacter thermophilus]|uniref:hypothetical protein n=1 Tax=Deferribacter thermophilus TaxID=53573 RepID=UPI003C21F975
MRSIKRTHVIILFILLLILILLVYTKYIRQVQISRFNTLKVKLSQIDGKISSNLIEFNRRLNTLSGIYSLKKQIINTTTDMANLLEYVKNKTYLSSVIKTIILDSGVKIDEFSFSGFDVNGIKFNNHYSVYVQGNIYNILKLLENIEYENEWLYLDSYKLDFKDDGTVYMTLNISAYGMIK